MIDPTIDPVATSWVEVAEGSDFPIQSLPFGVFRREGSQPRVGVAIGNQIVDMAKLEKTRMLAGIDLPARVFSAPNLNPYLECGQAVWSAVRTALFELLAAESPPDDPAPDSFLVAVEQVEMILPIAVGDYVDFYSSMDHAENVGRMFRPNEPPLLPNWRRLPVGYHGRASSIVVSGTPIRRPAGQRKPPEGGPIFEPTRRLDIELEVGFVTGNGNSLGSTIDVEDAERHIFGLCLVNDWSARDIQAWEYRPLGPFLGKSFATTISPWIVPLAALAPFRVPAPQQDPEPLPYLMRKPNLGVDIELAIDLNDTTVSRTSFKHMYWTMAQQLAHATANGANVRAGDLFASGTVSGPTADSLGSLLELSWNGTRPIALGGGETRTFLEDGDTVTLSGSCGGGGMPRLGFGPCTGTILPPLP